MTIRQPNSTFSRRSVMKYMASAAAYARPACRLPLPLHPKTSLLRPPTRAMTRPIGPMVATPARNIGAI